MARPRTPLAKAALTGADKKDPQRFRDRTEPVTANRPIGAPPTYFDEYAEKAWHTFTNEISWLIREDRAILEAACLMRAQIIRAGEGGDIDFPAAFWSTYRMIISSLGATPVDRTKVHQQKEEREDDPFAKFN